MNTQLVARQVRLKQWEGIIKSCQSSGMKIKEWCQLNNVSKDAYYYWLNKIKVAACETMEAGFAEVPYACTTVEIPAKFKAELTITIGSAIISVNSDTPYHLIQNAVKAASNA